MSPISKHSPRVSIGLPVFNGQPIIQNALDSLLSQTFTDFELIISDNASTDGTWELCQQYAQRDPRIRLHRNENNIGATANFESVLALAQGEYFMWASHDDHWEPEFIAACVEKLDQNPGAILCFTGSYEDNRRTGEKTALNIDFRNLPESEPERARFFLEYQPQPNVIMYGLYRRAMMQVALPFAPMTGTDSIFLLRCILHAPVVQAEPYLFTYINRNKRDERSRVKLYFGERANVFHLFLLDWRFMITLYRLLHNSTDQWKVRLRLYRTAWHFIHFHLGWPLSTTLVKRYAGLLLPERLYRHLLR